MPVPIAALGAGGKGKGFAPERRTTSHAESVARNAPFAGAFVTQQYGRPSRRQHALQLEIDRSLYMDERTITPRADFATFQQIIATVVAQLTEIGRAMPLAAE